MIERVLWIALHCNQYANMKKSLLNLTKKKKGYSKYSKIIPEFSLRRRLFSRLNSAIARCHDPKNPNYYNYGARGIVVCKNWHNSDRSDFLKHAITLSGWDDLLLDMDRIDGEKGYEPGNMLQDRTLGRLHRSLAALPALAAWLLMLQVSPW